MCLKLYCDCFANGEFCLDCNCKECHNNLEHESERSKAIKSSLERNPSAFKPKIGKIIFILINFFYFKVLLQKLDVALILKDYIKRGVIAKNRTVLKIIVNVMK